MLVLALHVRHRHRQVVGEAQAVLNDAARGSPGGADVPHAAAACRSVDMYASGCVE